MEINLPREGDGTEEILKLNNNVPFIEAVFRGNNEHNMEHITHVVATLMNMDTIELCITASSNPHYKRKVLKMAVIQGCLDVIKVVVEKYNIDINDQYYFNLDYDVLNNPDILDYFLSKGMDCNKVEQGEILFHKTSIFRSARCINRCEIFDKMMIHGLNLKIRDSRGFTFFEWFMNYCWIDNLEILIHMIDYGFIPDDELRNKECRINHYYCKIVYLFYAAPDNEILKRYLSLFEDPVRESKKLIREICVTLRQGRTYQYLLTVISPAVK